MLEFETIYRLCNSRHLTVMPMDPEARRWTLACHSPDQTRDFCTHERVHDYIRTRAYIATRKLNKYNKTPGPGRFGYKEASSLVGFTYRNGLTHHQEKGEPESARDWTEELYQVKVATGIAKYESHIETLARWNGMTAEIVTDQIWLTKPVTHLDKLLALL